VNIDLSNPNLSHTLVVELVGRDATVLDVGCADGTLARVLKTHGCRVSGVEGDTAAAETALEHLDDLVVADLNGTSLAEHFKPASFDVVVLSDVLEHVLEPEQLLKDAVSLLAPRGRVVMSVPNVAHGSLRLALLQGRWQYTATGLLDSSHRRFFTYDGLLELLDRSALVATRSRATVADPLEVEVEVADTQLPADVVEWVRDQPHALDYQFVVSACLAADADGAGHAVLEPAVSRDEVRAVDEHTHRSREDREARHRMLTVRDHIIGLEAQMASAQARQAKAEQRVKNLNAKARRERQRHAEQAGTEADSPRPGSKMFRRKG
jgi:2-polyprenyl-3-methyl-5-hydroxy-6-metoxy-1,4-benzoquinol methylase